MADDFGTGVSRTLSALFRQFSGVVWQKGKPPLDSELNLMGQISFEQLSDMVRAHVHSGWVVDPTRADADFVTNAAWSNYFKLGRQETGELEPMLWANVNGWMLPVTGTGVSEGDTSNQINLNPPPASDSRVDFVFLEAWKAQVAPNPSELNKPTSSTVWKYGNVEYGGTNIDDDIEDPTIGFETTERVQIQYRLRVLGSGAGLGSSVALDVYPDGLDDPNVLGQGTATTEVAGFTFTNMRTELGDPGLWRAGDGDPTNDLATVDGYTYAIPVCAVFRRNSQPFVASLAAGNANQNGAFNRNPSAETLTDPRTGIRTLTTATLTNALAEDDIGLIQVEDLVGSGLDDSSLSFPLPVVINGEIITIDAVDTTSSPATMTITATSDRGRWNTMANPHTAGSTVSFFNTRPDGLFSDEIDENTDILDLRRSVSFGDWDYQRLLVHNLTKLIQGQMKSTWKQSGAGDTQGPKVVEIGTLSADGSTSVPNQTEALDGPDGIRMTFSDAAVIQSDVTLLLNEDSPDPATSLNATGITWDVAPDFRPSGFLSTSGAWGNGSVINLYIGGADGVSGARASFRDNVRAVRFIAPREYWLSDTDTTGGLQHPITLRFLSEGSNHPAAGDEPLIEHPGPLYPLRSTGFTKPFMFLGGILNSNSQISSVSQFNDSPAAGQYEIQLPGLDFDTDGDWFSKTGTEFNNDPSLVSNPILDGQRTLYDLMTQGGRDRSGFSSEVFLVVSGDDTDDPERNNGVFRVIGAGATAGYTTNDATGSDYVRVQFIRPTGVADGFTATANTLSAELRSPYTSAQDGNGFGTGVAAAVIVLTDLEGTEGGDLNPWNSSNLGALALTQPLDSKLAVRTTLQYHPSRSGFARVPEDLFRVALVEPSSGSGLLRQAPSAIDSTFPSIAGTQSNEIYYDANHVQTWNRLPGLGLDAPDAPAYGGAIAVFSEQDREAEVFWDAGSKTLVFRPYQKKAMQFQSVQITSGELFPQTYPVTHGGGFAVDGATLFTTGRTLALPCPPEYMPRFGRLDIPFYNDVSSGTGDFLKGINHLFVDGTTETENQFSIIGGASNGGTPGVSSIFLQTGASSGLLYGQFAAIGATGASGYQARLFEDLTVQSSDVGKGMRGIQLPPFLGVARVYGVYERAEFLSAGGSPFDSSRVAETTSNPPNLLRTDASKQTLFIVQGGAEDITTNADDHTYVLPEEAINIQLSSNYVAGSTTFEDLEYVVELVVFGFARGFINSNNHLLVRRYAGAGGAEVLDSDDIALTDVQMVLPAPAPLSGSTNQVSVGATRPPYQGDPYMSRAGETRTTSDYEVRYGQVAQSDAFELSSAIQQFDSEGNSLIETPNARSLQVLASMDFYTTFGTGKIGGSLFPGTLTDVGYIEDTPQASTRVPEEASDPGWRVNSRAFSQGQADNANRAHLQVSMLTNSSADVQVIRPGGTTITFQEGVDWSLGADIMDSVFNLASAINASTEVNDIVVAFPTGTVLEISALLPGASGNQIEVSVSDTAVFSIREGISILEGMGTTTQSPLVGGVDRVVNAGMGSGQLDLAGMTERLPLGILLQDSDFISEDPLNTTASGFDSSLGSIKPVQSILPLDGGGKEFTRLLGGPGNWVGSADGGILRYTPYDEVTNTTGSRRFRLYRGGGSSYVLTDPRPGGPIDWFSGSFPAGLMPVLKGGVLACKALLVRNFPEVAFSTEDTTSHGGEIQMVILTRGILGKGLDLVQENGIAVSGIISPTGYGEGYAASDRYRLEGKPMMGSNNVTSPIDPNVDLADFPFDISTEVTC